MNPTVVGRYLEDGVPHFYPMSEPEMNRAMRAYLRVLETYNLPARSHVLVVSLASQVTVFMPLERALADRNYIISNADSSLFDAARVEMFIRRFDVAAVLGVTETVLEGLTKLGHDPAKLFRGRIVWATPEACDRLEPAEGYILRRWAELGPAVGVECFEGCGLHIASDEWHLDEEGGEILLTSRWSKLVPFNRQPTGLRASIDRTACPCGSTDARVRL